MIDVDHGEGERCARAFCPRRLHCQLFLDAGVIEQTGETVAQHQGAEETRAFGPYGDRGGQIIAFYRLGEELVSAKVQRPQLLFHAGFR